MIKHQKKQTGFTLIELVMVIVLIGLLSYSASSLFSSRGIYAGFIAKDQLTSSGLLAQQVAMSMSASRDVNGARLSDPVTLTVERALVGTDNVDSWRFTVMKRIKVTADNPSDPTTKTLIVMIQPISGSSIFIDGSLTAMIVGSSVTYTWNSDANMMDGNNHSVSFVGTNTHRVCISSSGYVYTSTSVCPL